MALKLPERGNTKTQRKTLEIEHSCLFIHHTICIYPFPHLILFNTRKKSLLKSSYPSQSFVPPKIPQSKISDAKKSFDHPRHSKSRVPPPPPGATRLGGSPHLSCKRDQSKIRDYMDMRVTSPTWGPPPPCKQALNLCS